MLKKIDYYIIKKFLSTFFFAILLFTFVSVIIDLTEKVDSFIEHNVGWKLVVFDYYLNFIPYIDALLTPLFVFISVIFFTSKLASHSEIIAMLAGGAGIYRILKPYMIANTIIAMLLLLFNHFIVPEANKRWQAFEYTYLSNKNILKLNKNIQGRTPLGHFIYIENYVQLDTTGYKFSLEIFKNDTLEYKLKADRIDWNGTEQKWRLNNYVIRKFTIKGETIIKGTEIDTTIGFVPSDLYSRMSIKEEMQTPELLDYIKHLKTRGEKYLPFYEIEYHRRTADAFMTFILTIIGYSIASRRIRGGIGLHIVAGFALSAIYILLTRFTTTFSTNGSLPAFFGVWIPNFLFLILAIYLLKKAQQ